MKRVLLRFRQENCPSCGRIAPFVRDMVSRVAVDSYSIDVQDRPDLVELYNIRSVPSFVVLEDDQPVYTGVGAGCLPELARVLGDKWSGMRRPGS